MTGEEKKKAKKIALIATHQDLALIRLRAAMRGAGYTGLELDEIITDTDLKPEEEEEDD